MCTFVCKVQDDSSAESAGLTTGETPTHFLSLWPRLSFNAVQYGFHTERCPRATHYKTSNFHILKRPTSRRLTNHILCLSLALPHTFIVVDVFRTIPLPRNNNKMLILGQSNSQHRSPRLRLVVCVLTLWTYLPRSRFLSFYLPLAVVVHVGDVIVTINGVSIEGLSHQHIVDLIRKSTNFLQWVKPAMTLKTKGLLPVTPKNVRKTLEHRSIFL